LVASHVVGSLILLMITPLDPLYVTLVYFIYSSKSFSLVFSSRYYAGGSPLVGRTIIFSIKSISMENCVSNHKMPPCMTSSNCLTQLFTSFPLTKCRISNRFMIPMLYNPCIHSLGSIMGTLVTMTPIPYKYTCCANSGNLSVSLTSWSK